MIKHTGWLAKDCDWTYKVPSSPGIYLCKAEESNFEPYFVEVYTHSSGCLCAWDGDVGADIESYHEGLGDTMWRKEKKWA